MIVARQTVDGATLQARIAASELGWFYGERLGSVVLWRASELQDGTRWRYGVLFDQSAELSWQQVADGFELRWVSDTSVAWGDEISAESLSTSNTLLAGSNDATTDDWAAARIPQRLRYPVAPAPTVTLETATLWLPDEKTTITRLCGVVAGE